MFLTEEDYKAVADEQGLSLLAQSDEANRQRAERYAIEEVSGYLRGRYDAEAAFAATGEARNALLVMRTCDVALYHLCTWLPRRMGYEIRRERYDLALAWLRDVQNGKSSPALPVPQDESGADTGNPIRWGSRRRYLNEW